MLKFYLLTIIIWLVANLGVLRFYCMQIMDNGWLELSDPTDINAGRLLGSLFLMSAVPILRLLVFGVNIYMGTHTKQEFEEWVEKNTQE